MIFDGLMQFFYSDINRSPTDSQSEASVDDFERIQFAMFETVELLSRDHFPGFPHVKRYAVPTLVGMGHEIMII